MTTSAPTIPDQTGRTFVVTGAAGGLGRILTRALAERGATVVMACRNTATAGAVAAEIDGDVRVARLDLAELRSVREFADQQGEFDVLINNAGLMNIPFSRTADGFETQFGVNHLGHFALTGLLLDRIGDRVVTLSSIAHRQARRLCIDDLNYRLRPYRRRLAYAQSKLANLMFARELQHRLAGTGSTVRSYAVHPGVAATDLFTRTETVLDRFAKQGAALVGHPPIQAAQSTLFAATDPGADPQVYWGPTRLFGARGPVGAAPSTRLSQSRSRREQLFAVSEELTGVEYRR